MICLTDALEGLLRLASKPKRIVSLVPSVTEDLLHMGVRPIGRTQFCIYPKDKVASIACVGGTKNPNIEQIVKLTPDLVIANQEENRREDVLVLRQLGFPVWLTYPRDVPSVLDMLRDMASLSAKPEMHRQSIAGLAGRVMQCKRTKQAASKRIAIVIWRKPWMLAGRETYLNALIEWCGFGNACTQARYPKYELEELLALELDVLLLPSEPYPFTQTHRRELCDAFGQRPVRVFCVQGEALTWPGNRVEQGLGLLQELLEVDNFR